MPKYRVVEQSFIDNHIVEVDQIITYDPPEGTTIGSNLELVVDENLPPPAKGDK